MPDISLCLHDSCPKRLGCYRYTAEPNDEWQSYTTFDFVLEDGEVKCDYFVTNKPFREQDKT